MKSASQPESTIFRETVQLRDVRSLDPVLALLAWWFGATVNLYVTAPGGSGLPRHGDACDIVVVQLHGSKDWGFRWSRAGEVWLLPADTEHECRAGPDGSVHLTFGLLRSLRLRRCAAVRTSGSRRVSGRS